MNTLKTETEQKKKGQYFTPDDIVDKMINFADLDYTGNIYDPTAGDGNIVMKDRKILTMDEDRIYEECDRICRRLGMIKELASAE